MSTRVRPRFGSLQYWPRKRVRRAIPRVNWEYVKKTNSSEGVLGLIGYKVGMATAIVKDDGDKSQTKGKKIGVPVSILEVPKMKVFSVRFYSSGKVSKDIVVSNDKVLKRKLKVPKALSKFDDIKTDGFDDIRIIVYSVMKDTFKKTPDFAELAIQGQNFESKLEFVKGLIGKEIGIDDVLKWSLIDVRGVTRGKGFQGPVKRFGITLKGHKSEKGVRKPGSLGPWHPSRVTFRVPMAGQLGTFTRVHYNLKVIDIGNVNQENKNINKKEGFKNYGKINGDYIILAGSVQGPVKRQILITPAIRPTKKQLRKKFEVLEIK